MCCRYHSREQGDVETIPHSKEPDCFRAARRLFECEVLAALQFTLIFHARPHGH